MIASIKASDSAVFLGGPYCGHEFSTFPFIGRLIGPGGHYYRSPLKSKSGRAVFKWRQATGGGSQPTSSK